MKRTRAPLWWQMLRTGLTAARAGESGRTRFLALVMATVVAALTGAAFVASAATFDARETRGQARNPVMAEHGQQPKALWSRYWDSEQGRQYSVVIVWPLTADAPLPPGLPRWPAPGEAFLSPALAHAPADADFTHRYGQAVGQIGQTGLATPGERLVYTRPSQAMLNSSYLDPIVGFGSIGPSFGDLKAIESDRATQLNLIMLALLGLPAAGLTVAAARIGAPGHDRRARLLAVLGANRAARAWMDFGAAALPVLTGAIAAAALVTPALFFNLTLPWINFTLAATDLRHAAGSLVLALAGAVAFVIAVTLLLQPSADRRTHRTGIRVTEAGVLRRLALAACPAFLLLAVTTGPLLGGGQRSAFGYLFAVLGVWATLAPVIGWITARYASRMAAAAHRTGEPGRLIAARRLAAHPGAVVRLVATLVIAIGVIGQTQLISTLLYNRSDDNEYVGSARGQSMALVQAADRARPSSEFRAALPGGIHMVSLGHVNLSPDGSSSRRLIQAPCADLTDLHLPCPAGHESPEVTTQHLDRRLRATTYAYFGDTPATVRTGPTARLDPEDTWLVVFTPDGSALDLPAIKRAARLTLSTDSVIRPLSEGNGSNILGLQARWIPFLGTIGTLYMATAMVFSSLSEFIRFARTLAPLTVLTGNSTIFRTTALWSLSLPITIAGAGGVAAYVVLAQPISGGSQGAQLSLSLCIELLVLTLVLAAVAAGAASLASKRETRQWRPRAD
ncbi:hypothetical protein [Streptomyces sp. SID1034]|uniref:hypothetical protein n=1 Tax=Streptomyces sp. SID1034 TaxID=2690248 RepID=UPI0013699A89|nr:hypothetical protein [Streptomyces sp. SID1034]MYV95912.1 hypothetical protein [Streptomyces sp. SID1034]